nr:Hint domain-containing protein [Thalassococcus arenae]
MAPGGGGGAIVFEGTDENGDLAHVVWSPDFDLENWYWTNFNPSAEPEFYTTDQNASYEHSYVCFERTVPLHTPTGLTAAGRLKVGDRVCTWGGSARAVRWIGRKKVSREGGVAVIRFDRGAIGNFAPIKLSPQHRVLIATDSTAESHGSRDVLVPAISLVDGQKVRAVTRKQVVFVHILLDRHDILIAAGAPCESLLLGAQTELVLGAAQTRELAQLTGPEGMVPCYPILRRREAQSLAAARAVPERDAALM